MSDRSIRLAWALVLVCGCSRSTDVGDGAAPGPDGSVDGSSGDASLAIDGPAPNDAATYDAGPFMTDSVDLLLMIDNSSSMTEHQVQLQSQLPRLVTMLLGITPVAPHSLHIGVVSSTMGLGPIPGVPGCAPGFGDDGILFHGSPYPQAGCMADYSATYPHGVFEFIQGGTTTASQYTSDVACVAVLGTGGCGLEFELEPVLKGLAPAPDATGASSVTWTAPGYVPPTFYSGTFGHGSDPFTNGSFLRPTSLLAILTLCDEDDGSTDQYQIFSDDPRYNSVALNVRPVQFSSMLFPVQRYVDGLIGLRQRPVMLVLSEIVGIPNDLSPAAGAPTTPAVLSQILNDPRMVPTIDPAQPERLIAVCHDDTGAQTAVPGYRMVQVAQGLQARGVNVGVHSICLNDFAPAIDDLVANIARAL
jgi:hypothetical protein